VRLVTALTMGVFAYFLVGFVTGYAPDLRFRRRGARSQVGRGQLWLHQAGLAVTPGQFAIASVGVGVVAFAVVTAMTGTPLVALVPAGAVAALPRAYFARRRAARLSRVQEAWPDGLRDLLASITAGRSLPQALTTLASSGPVPLREAFERFPLLSRMLGTVPALEVVKEELADPTSDRVVEVLILAQERGGQVVRDILEGLEMKINARVVLVLPWVVLVALTIRAGPFRDFYQSGGGLVVVALGGALSVVGYVVISRLGRSQYERRVFGAGAQVVSSE
jgi:tight adherence protein B